MIEPGVSVQTSVVLSRISFADVAADHRVVELDFDIEVGQQPFGDFAAVAVGALGRERVRARFAVGEIDERDGGHAAGDDERVPGVFELGDARGQLERGGRAVDAVGRRAAGLPVVVGVGEVFEDDGRAAVGGRRERAEAGRGVGGGVDEARAPVERRRVLVGFVVHGASF